MYNKNDIWGGKKPSAFIVMSLCNNYINYSPIVYLRLTNPVLHMSVLILWYNTGIISLVIVQHFFLFLICIHSCTLTTTISLFRHTVKDNSTLIHYINLIMKCNYIMVFLNSFEWYTLPQSTMFFFVSIWWGKSFSSYFKIVFLCCDFTPLSRFRVK